MHQTIDTESEFLSLHEICQVGDPPSIDSSELVHARYYFSLNMYELSLKLYKNCFSGLDYENPSLSHAAISNNLAVVHEKLGNYQEAKNCFKTSLIIMQKLPEENLEQKIRVSLGLATVTTKLAQYDEAQIYLDKAWDLLSSIKESHSDLMITFLETRGSLLRAISEYEEGYKDHQKAIELHIAKFGNDSIILGPLYENLAFSLKLLGRFVEALQVCRKAQAIYSQKFGDLPPNAITLYCLLAFLQAMLGDTLSATESIDISLRTFKKYFSTSNHLDYAQIEFVYGMIFFCQQRGDKAKEKMSNALEIYSKVGLQDHPEVTNICNTLGLVYASLGAFEEAIRIVQKGEAIIEKLFGKDHPKASGCHNSLGLICIKKNDFFQGFQHYMKCLRLLTKKFGVVHPYIGNILNNVFGLLKWNGVLSLSSTSLINKTMMIYKHYYGNEHKFYTRNKDRIFHVEKEKDLKHLDRLDSSFKHNPV